METLLELIDELKNKSNSAVIMISHDLGVVAKLCDKIAIIKNGHLIASGTMEEVKGDASLEEVFLELTEEA